MACPVIFIPHAGGHQHYVVIYSRAPFFNDLAYMLIQSINCDVRLLYVVLSWKPVSRWTGDFWLKSVLLILAH